MHSVEEMLNVVVVVVAEAEASAVVAAEGEADRRGVDEVDAAAGDLEDALLRSRFRTADNRGACGPNPTKCTQ
jgi:hypothetical protein